MNTSVIGTLAEKRVRSKNMYTPNAGELQMLENIVTKENMKLKLYVNKKDPASGDTAGTYTEAIGGGYAEKSLTGDTGANHWVISTVNEEAVASYPQQTFSFTAGITGATGGATGGVAVAGSKNVTVVSTTGMIAGNRISCTTCVPAGSYVTSVNGATGFSMNNDASANGSSLTIVYQNQIWGSFLIGATTGKLYRVFEAQYSWYPDQNGDNYNVIPTITLKEGTQT